MLTSRVDFRICPSCFNVVDHDEYDVLFTCDSCETRLYISTSDSQLAIKGHSDETLEPVENFTEKETLSRNMEKDEPQSLQSSNIETENSLSQASPDPRQSTNLRSKVAEVLDEPLTTLSTDHTDVSIEVDDLLLGAESPEPHTDLELSDIHLDAPSYRASPVHKKELDTLIEELLNKSHPFENTSSQRSTTSPPDYDESIQSNPPLDPPEKSESERDLNTYIENLISESSNFQEPYSQNTLESNEGVNYELPTPDKPLDISSDIAQGKSTPEVVENDVIDSEELDGIELIDEEIQPIHEENMAEKPLSDKLPLFKKQESTLLEDSLEAYTVSSKVPVEKKYNHPEPRLSDTENTTTTSPASFKKKIAPRALKGEFNAATDADLSFVSRSSHNKKPFSPIQNTSMINEAGLGGRRNVERKLFDLESRAPEDKEKLENEVDTDDELGVLIRESIQEEEQKKKKAFKRRGKLVKSFVAFAAFITLALTIAFFFITSKKKEETVTLTSQQEAEDKVEEDKYLEELIDVSVARKSLENFFKAKTLAEAEKYVLPDANIKQALAKYWKPTPEFSEITFSNSTYLPGFTGAVYYYECTFKGQNTPVRYPVFAVKGEEHPLVDWRTPNQMEDLSVNEIISSKGTGTYNLRCGITLEDYYNYGYSRDGWFSLSIWDTVNFINTDKNRLDGFLNKNSDLARAILYQLQKQSGFLTLQGKAKAENTTFDDLLKEPVGLDEIYGSLTPPEVNSYAKLILEIKVTNAEKRVVEITDLVCVSVIEYYERFQKPYLASQIAKTSKD